MAIKKVCTTHHVEIKTQEDDMAHMRNDCVIYETGSGLGAIEAVDSNNRTITEAINYHDDVILPYDTQSQKDARRKALGIPITEAPVKTK